MTIRHAPITMALCLAAAACASVDPPLVPPLAGPVPAAEAMASRIGGSVGSTEARRAIGISLGASSPGGVPGAATGALPAGGPRDISLEFADTDIREVAAQILGSILHLNYSIDPAVHGTATLHTASPLSRDQVLPALEALLAQNAATLVFVDGFYRVVPSTAAAAATGLSAAPGTAGNEVVRLRYATADDLAHVLQPFVGNNGRILPDPARNALLIGGEPAVRASLLELVRAFDVDVLAGQSYALLPVSSGDAKDFASSLQTALRGQAGGALAGRVKVIPMDRVNAVLVVAPSRQVIDQARRVFALVDQARTETTRAWHVYYLQNGSANDVAYVLQQAFTPNAVTAQPSGSALGQAGGAAGGSALGGTARANGSMAGGSMAGGSMAGGGMGNGSMAGGQAGGGLASGGLASGGLSSGGLGGGLPGTGGQGGALPNAGDAAGAAPGANPLLGALDPTGGTTGADTTSMRIIPNPQNNAILIFTTRREQNTIEAMLHKIDILPLQVRIDATIAEVTLNDQLKYGTQFFFKSGGINGALSSAVTTVGGITSGALGSGLPGFLVGGSGSGGAPFAISALQNVTNVNVLSSPQLLVLDNQAARLQVGNLVPYLTSSSQSTIVGNAPVINSVAYQPTGVIMQITPRVNSGGLVTLDISQEVSDVDPNANTNGITSPTFLERSVTSRVVVQDGQTIGLAGLIRDSASTGNQGIPWLKDIPVLGALAGTQNNVRTRTELLVLVTPHVLHDQRDARALTEDLRAQLPNAAVVPDVVNALRPSGSDDPNRSVRRRLHLDR